MNQDLSIETVKEVREDLKSISLDIFLMDPETARLPKHEALVLYATAQVGAIMGELVVESEDLTPEDRAFVAGCVIDTIVSTAQKHGAHRHKLAADLRAQARAL